MPCQCLQCGSDRTAAAYYCIVDDLGWVVTSPDSDPTTGRPMSSRCPDSIFQSSNNDPTALEQPGSCRNDVLPKTLFCYNCGAVEVFEP